MPTHRYIDLFLAEVGCSKVHNCDHVPVVLLVLGTLVSFYWAGTPDVRLILYRQLPA
jgi:hypothetical protein